MNEGAAAVMEPEIDLEVLTHDSNGQGFIPGTEPKVIPELADKVKEVHETRLIALEYSKREKKAKEELADLMRKYDAVVEDDHYAGIKRYWAGDLVVEFSVAEREVIKTHSFSEKSKKSIDDRRVALTSSEKTDALDSLILRAIEESMAWTVADIVDDTGMSRVDVKESIVRLQQKGFVRVMRRYVPGSGRPQYSIKSTRIDYPEAN